MTATIDEIGDRLRAEGWLCLEGGDRRQWVTIVARKREVTVSVSAAGRETAWEKLAARIAANDGATR